MTMNEQTKAKVRKVIGDIFQGLQFIRSVLEDSGTISQSKVVTPPVLTPTETPQSKVVTPPVLHPAETPEGAPAAPTLSEMEAQAKQLTGSKPIDSSQLEAAAKALTAQSAAPAGPAVKGPTSPGPATTSATTKTPQKPAGTVVNAKKNKGKK